MLGVLGVGHLAAAILAGLARAGWQEVLLSPRGRAAEMADRYGFGLAADNRDLVARCDVILLAVRPRDAVGAIADLPWRAGQVLVSACAGVPLASLQAGPARVQRIMPITAAEIGLSPTVCFPDFAESRFLQALGPVIPVPSEVDFETATVSAAVYGWVQDLIRQTADWSAAQGLPTPIARQLVARTFMAAGGLIAERPEPMAKLLEELVTPGGITELGLKQLAAHQVPEGWQAACDAVLARLRGL